MADASPGLPQISSDIARHERRLDAFEATFVRRDVYDAERDADRARITRLEGEGTSKTRGNRAAVLAGISATATAVVLEAVNALMRGLGH